MWTMTFLFLSLGLAETSASKVNQIEFPTDIILQDSITQRLNANYSVYPKIISHSYGDVNDRKLSSIDPMSDSSASQKNENVFQKNANISQKNADVSQKNADVFQKDANVFQRNANISQKNRPADGSMTWDKVNSFLDSNIRATLLAENNVAMIQTTNASDACKRGLARYLDSLSKQKAWAVRMAAADGEISGGILGGTLMFLGFFDECVGIRAESLAAAGEEEEDFRGQYCLVQYISPLLRSAVLKNGTLDDHYTYGQPPEWVEDFIIRSGPYRASMNLTLGTCVPSVCSDVELKHILMKITAPLDLQIEVRGCQVDQPMIWTKSFTSAVSALLVIAILCTIGTVIDIVERFAPTNENALESNASLVLKMFSVLSNAEMLLNRESGGSFACLDGIRFLSTTWIVLGHIYSSDTLEPLSVLKYRNFLNIGDTFNGSVSLAVIDNFTTAIGTFFFVSGLLLSHSLCKKLSKNEEKVNIFKYLLHKYWRLTPALALTITVFLVEADSGSGPLWTTTTTMESENCRQRWWQNFLYINNWWGLEEMCLGHTWFLSCLMQLHVIGSLLLYFTFRRPVFGILVGLGLYFSCTAAVALLVIWKRLPLPKLLTPTDGSIDNGLEESIYLRPYYHIHAYTIGMLVGYLILKYKDKKIKPRYQVLAWILSIICCVYAVYGIIVPGNSLAYTTFFYSTHYMAWSIGLGWLTYACISGYGGALNRFLSWKAFSFLNSLSYLVYLFHLLVILRTTASLREITNYGHYELICLFLSNLVVSYFFAFVGHVAVEMPFTHLERLIF